MISVDTGMTSKDMEMEQQRRRWEDDEWQEMERRRQEEALKDERIQVRVNGFCPCPVNGLDLGGEFAASISGWTQEAWYH